MSVGALPEIPVVKQMAVLTISEFVLDQQPQKQPFIDLRLQRRSQVAYTAI